VAVSALVKEPIRRKSGSYLGIQYGHGYVFFSLNNRCLGRDSATKYIVNGEKHDVVFVFARTSPTASLISMLMRLVNGT
jgi:hypothetical protein